MRTTSEQSITALVTSSPLSARTATKVLRSQTRVRKKLSGQCHRCTSILPAFAVSRTRDERKRHPGRLETTRPIVRYLPSSLRHASLLHAAI